ncbi:MAG: hypothetical protein ACOX5G_09465 [Kiritimatiellia bacterium]|jgi:hypothetical protein
MKRFVLFLLTASIAAVCACHALTICPACGYEAEDGATTCAHCNAALPAPGADAALPAPAETPDPLEGEASDAAMAALAFEEAKQDMLFGREQEEAGKTALALAAYENALALLTFGYDDPRVAAGAAAVAAESVLRCRRALAIGWRACPSCNGTGKRTYTARVMGGDDVVREVAGSSCGECGGSGRVRAARSSRELVRAVAKATGDFAILCQGRGRTACGRVWIPAKWNLGTGQTARLRCALPDVCPECAGFHDVDCPACKGEGTVPCRNKGCRQGLLETKNPNTLSPKTELAIHTPCPVCKGTGRTPCAICKGECRVPCKSCDGSGLAPACRSCDGSGLTPCKSCRGSGKDRNGEPCAACQGEGRQLCAKCQGDGRTGR